MEDIKLLEEILKSFVNEPKSLKICRDTDDMGVLFKIDAPKEDRALIIGKKGMTISSIRAIFRMIGYKNKARYSIQVIEEEDGRKNNKYPKAK